MRMAVMAAGQWTDAPADTGNLVREILWGLCRQHPAVTFLLVSKKKIDSNGLPPNVQPLVVSPVLNKYYWEAWQLPRALKKEKADQLLVLNDWPPVKSKIPVTLLVSHSHWLQAAADKRLAELPPRLKQLIVFSATLRDIFTAMAPGLAGKVLLLKPGQDAHYGPLEWDERQRIKQEHAGGTEYFLATGSIDPRNNTMPLLKAYSVLKKRLRSNVKLILAGEVTTAGKEVMDALASYRFREDVIWVKQPDAATLAGLTAGAYGLVYTNRHDGLALPVYHALHCNVPVVAFDSPAVREAGGPAVLYADPAHPDDLAEKMMLLYKDERLRASHLAAIPGSAHLPDWHAVVQTVAAALGLQVSA